MPTISTIVICRDEADNIERCLKSVAGFSDEIIVVDSGSTDDTVALATPLATKVITHEWEGYGRQKQFALEQATSEWVFSIDADEEVSPGLAAEIGRLDFAAAGYDMPRKVHYLGRWIHHSGWYPGHILRLFRRDRGQFTDEILHERVVVDGKVARLHNDLYHYSYRNIGHHLAKLNDFTSLAAEKMRLRGRRAGVASIACRPFFEFMKVFIVRRGFLDGHAGLVISILHAYYVFLKYAKLYELNKTGGGR